VVIVGCGFGGLRVPPLIYREPSGHPGHAVPGGRRSIAVGRESDPQAIRHAGEHAKVSSVDGFGAHAL